MHCGILDRVRLYESGFGPPSILQKGLEALVYTSKRNTRTFVRLSRLFMRRVARIDGEVHRLVEFEGSCPTYSLELLDILVRPYSRTSACGIRDSSGNSL